MQVVFDAGRYLGLYRKSHIPDGPGYTEKFYFNPGDTGFKVFQTQFAAIGTPVLGLCRCCAPHLRRDDAYSGVAICWDQWFPEAARAMALLVSQSLHSECSSLFACAGCRGAVLSDRYRHGAARLHHQLAVRSRFPVSQPR